jgi:hydroxyacylglutathione hydrolase
MIFEQFYLECLSHASYLIGDTSTGRAVVVDPQRDVQQYLDSAKSHGLKIELVLETHFHADFLSGHLELAKATGATIGYGSVAKPQFAARSFADGERYALGEVALEIRHTPGHTPESVSIVVFEHANDKVPYGVLTGDTMFIGDVGRPDLLVSVGKTSDELGRMLFNSLNNKLLTLPDATRVYPAHGAGSACGKNLSTETMSTIGEQRKTNYALQFTDIEKFVDVVTEGQPPAPGYFIYDAQRNSQVRDVLDEHAVLKKLTISEVVKHVDAGAVVLDTRDPQLFATGHIVGSINVGMDGRYAEYAGAVVSPGTTSLLPPMRGTSVKHESGSHALGTTTLLAGSRLTNWRRHPNTAKRVHD